MRVLHELQNTCIVKSGTIKLAIRLTITGIPKAGWNVKQYIENKKKIRSKKRIT